MNEFIPSFSKRWRKKEKGLTDEGKGATYGGWGVKR
jgi:hypothetical protein